MSNQGTRPSGSLDPCQPWSGFSVHRDELVLGGTAREDEVLHARASSLASIGLRSLSDNSLRLAAPASRNDLGNAGNGGSGFLVDCAIEKLQGGLAIDTALFHYSYDLFIGELAFHCASLLLTKLTTGEP